MKLLYTKRFRINFVFSFFLSLFLTVMSEGILSEFPDGVNPAYELKSFIGVSVFLLSNLFFTRKYRRRRKIILTDFPSDWGIILEKYVPFYSLLNEDERYIFRKKIQLFLCGVHITGVGMEIDDITRVLVASGAVIPVFKVLDWEYTMITDIFVCPDNLCKFFPIRCIHSDITGLVVHNKSAVYLTKESLLRGFSKTDGNNTGIHEFIHKIDEGSGNIDGILPPPFLSKKERSEWLKIIDNEMARLKEADSPLHPYALTNRAEFIAVAAEFFFERPLEMKERHPKLFRFMEKLFRQNFSSSLEKEMISMFKP